MTVKELRHRLSHFDESAKVVVYWERDGKSDLLEIHDVSMQTGKPERGADGKPGFVFDHRGPATWLFISVNEG
jgi:hypothetical protein